MQNNDLLFAFVSYFSKKVLFKLGVNFCYIELDVHTEEAFDLFFVTSFSFLISILLAFWLDLYCLIG